MAFKDKVSVHLDLNILNESSVLKASTKYRVMSHDSWLLSLMLRPGSKIYTVLSVVTVCSTVYYVRFSTSIRIEKLMSTEVMLNRSLPGSTSASVLEI